MKKFVFMLATLFAVAINSNAQYNVTGHRFFDNWSIGVDGGVQTNLHDWNTPQGAVANLHLDKQITPVYGLTFETTLGFNNTANWMHPVQSHIHNGTVVDNLAAYAVGRVNLMNWFGGVTERPRVFEVEPFAGVGYGHGWCDVNDFLSNPNGTHRETNNGLLTKAGVNLNFNVGPARAWTLSLKPAVVYAATNTNRGIGLDARYAVAQLTAGVTYHFNTSNGSHHFTSVPVPTPVVQEVVKEVPVEVEKIVEVVKEVASPAAVHQSKYMTMFGFDSAELTVAAKSELDNVPEGVTVDVDSWASPEGSAEYNLELSNRRATAVKEYLESRGVTVDNVTAHGANNAQANRVAIVTVK